MSSEKSLDIWEASEYNIKLSQAVLRCATVFRARRTIFEKVRTASVEIAPAALGGSADEPLVRSGRLRGRQNRIRNPV